MSENLRYVRDLQDVERNLQKELTTIVVNRASVLKVENSVCPKMNYSWISVWFAPQRQITPGDIGQDIMNMISLREEETM